MNAYRIQSFHVANLWGHKTLTLTFHPDITILIGENGTGKTTILNLLRAILTADSSLFSYNFTKAIVKLTAFSNGSTKTIRVSPTDTEIAFQLSRQTFTLSPRSPRALEPWPGLLYPQHKTESEPVSEALKDLVPLVWLPVSRRLPVPDEDPTTFSQFSVRSHSLESVDQRLRELIRELSEYRLRLESKVSDRYKAFERTVLETILYSAAFDSMGALQRESPPSREDQEELIRVFNEVGILDSAMKTRIQAHFARADEALKTLQSPKHWKIEDLFIIPLIRRTQSLVARARTLGAERDEIFSPLRRYEKIVNDFLLDKRVAVNEDGKLTVTYTGTTKSNRFAVDQLSSGEKQILILLTAALLQADNPVVYMADEPELSLHVSWQEKLLGSLLDIGGSLQLIVATHSPDIAGQFHDNLVELSR